MQNFKERLYNHESTPPPEIWDNISEELDSKNSKLLPMPGLRKRSKFIFYGLTAAASLIIIFISSVLFNKTGKFNKTEKFNNTGENIKSKNTPSLNSGNLISQKVKDSLFLNNKTLEAIIKSSKNKNQLAKNYDGPVTNKKYLTIQGPECQPVKISPKVATLIESADSEYPPRAVWNKKIDKWRQIMLGSTISLTSTSLLDIAQLSSSSFLDNSE
ncbi:MAG: hypothetical protein ABI863_07305 [Ginsengibacter sp.]